jgi:hypothetical protein
MLPRTPPRAPRRAVEALGGGEERRRRAVEGLRRGEQPLERGDETLHREEEASFLEEEASFLEEEASFLEEEAVGRAKEAPLLEVKAPFPGEEALGRGDEGLHLAEQARRGAVEARAAGRVAAALQRSRPIGGRLGSARHLALRLPDGHERETGLTRRNAMRVWSGRLTTLVALGLLCLAPSAAGAEIDPGVRAGVYSDASEGFVGVELLTDITPEWFFNPNLEYVFVDNGSLWTLNGDVHYDLDIGSPWAVWLGGGLGVIFREVDLPRGRSEDETDLGLNLLAGAGAQRGALRPYVQGKVIIADDTEAVIAIGLRFH